VTQGIARCVLACLGVGVSLAAPAGRSTAVFTLDSEYSEFADVPGKSLKAQFQAWAQSCDIVPHEGVFRLECPPPRGTARQHERRDDSEAVKASLVLFRDLDEVVYLAGCPVFEKESPESERDRRRERALQKPLKKSVSSGLDDRDARDCRDLAAGQTFSTEVERDTVKIVVRGRQLSLTLFEMRRPETNTSSTYQPRPSNLRQALGTLSARDSSRPLPAPAEPEFSPPPLDGQSAGRPSTTSAVDAPTARTSLRTGHLALKCPSSQTEVYVDNAYYGACPVGLPLVAGRHSVTVRQRGRDDWVREFEITAGKTVRLSYPAM